MTPLCHAVRFFTVPQMLESLFKATDVNSNGLVDLSEFLAMLGHLAVGVSVEKVCMGSFTCSFSLRPCHGVVCSAPGLV